MFIIPIVYRLKVVFLMYLQFLNNVCSGSKLLDANNISSQKTIIYLLKLIHESFSYIHIQEEKPNTMTLYVVEI